MMQEEIALRGNGSWQPNASVNISKLSIYGTPVVVELIQKREYASEDIVSKRYGQFMMRACRHWALFSKLSTVRDDKLTYLARFGVRQGTYIWRDILRIQRSWSDSLSEGVTRCKKRGFWSWFGTWILWLKPLPQWRGKNISNILLHEPTPII